MIKSISKTLTLGLAAGSLFGLHSAIASEDKLACRQTALQMLQACHAAKLDSFKTQLANCTNLNDRSERNACRREAGLTKRQQARNCKAQFKARIDACDTLGETRYDPDPLLNPAITFVDPNAVDPGNANPYVSIVAGHTYVLRGGKEGEETVVVHATDEVREIQGAACRVVADIVLESAENELDGSIEYLPVEITDDWFAQDAEGNVYYCGELVRNYSDGLLRDLGGSFEAGRDSAKAGALVLRYPAVGSAHRQEFSLGVAEDIIQYLDLAAYPDNENAQFPCREAGGCLMTYEFTPLEPEASAFKYYIPGTGFVLAEAMENGELTGERETLVCVGESLDVLRQPECGIADPASLMETLCDVSPDVFCE